MAKNNVYLASKPRYEILDGLLVSRLMNSGSQIINFQSSILNLKHGFWWCSLAIVVLLCMPWMGLGTEGEDRWTNGLYEAFCM